MTTLFVEILRKDAEALGIKLDSSMLADFRSYYQELKRWSRAYNLTALKDERDIAERLFVDSLGYHLISMGYRVSRILDVGSGAGFPGLVLAILRPETPVTLIEPSRKKTAFLRAVIKRLSLKNAEVFDTTVEEFVKDCNERFDLITTRALFSAKELLKKTYPVQAREAVLLLSKGKQYKKEISEIEGISGGIQSSCSIEHREFRIPSSKIVRNFIIIKIFSGRSVWPL